MGVPIDRDTRVGALAFADDLATVTTTWALQQAAIDELEAFEKSLACGSTSKNVC